MHACTVCFHEGSHGKKIRSAAALAHIGRAETIRKDRLTVGYRAVRCLAG